MVRCISGRHQFGGKGENVGSHLTPEGKVKAEVIEFLKNSGLLWFRMQSGKVAVKRGFLHLAPIGTADMLVFKGTEAIWIELKAPGQRTKKEREEKQQEFADMVLGMGHKHIKATSLDEVIEFVK
jgi:hypothetical protein